MDFDMDMDKDMDRVRVRDEGLRMDMGAMVARPVERERMRVSELVRHVDSPSACVLAS